MADDGSLLMCDHKEPIRCGSDTQEELFLLRCVGQRFAGGGGAGGVNLPILGPASSLDCNMNGSWESLATKKQKFSYSNVLNINSL